MARSFLYTNTLSWEEVFSGPYTIASSSDTSFIVSKTIDGVECSIAYTGSALLGNNPVIKQVLVTSRQTGADLGRIVRDWDGQNDPDITRSIHVLQSGGLDSFTHLMTSEYWGVQIGSDQADVMTAYANAPDLNGGDDSDTLINSTGEDWLSGGSGFDYASYETASAGVFVSFDGHPDLNTGEAYGDRYFNTEGLIGSDHNDYFIGDGARNHLLGGNGNDTLLGTKGYGTIGVRGDDTLDGGAGVDTAQFRLSRANYDIKDAGDGYWRVSDRTADRDGTALIINIEFLQFADQTIVAPTGPVPIYGTFGADTLIGTSGVDTIYGSSGDDTLYGRAGDDIIHGDGDNDRLYGEADNDELYGGEGNDILDGGTGTDTLRGGAGNDTYILNDSDRIEEAADRGIDTVQTTRNNYTLGANLENLTLLGTIQDGSGNALNNVIIGNDATNLLQGDAGNDILNGGGGSDIYYGGTGDDTFIVNQGDQIVDGDQDDGIDTVVSSIAFTLEYFLENLTLAGTAAINGTGNEFDNEITGNVAANIIDGAGGVDTLRGGEGDDTYIVYGGVNGNERIEEAAGGGTDTIIFKGVGNYTLGVGVNVEILKANPDSDWGDLTGNALGTKFYGNRGRNTIDGGGGDDTLVLSGAQTDYTITQNDDGSFTIADKNNQDDVDKIHNIEILEFSGGKMVTPGSLFPPSDVKLDGDVVFENTKAGNPVGELRAVDNSPDAHQFELIDDAGGRFKLETVNGVTRLMVKDGVRLDYEQANRHSITVKVTDGSGGTVTRTLAVQIQDSLNENATGSAGADLIKGGNGRDTFSGAAGNDTLSAGAGDDRLTGNDGNDRLIGGLGKDTLAGSKGRDVFAFDDRETGSSKTKADYITDFKGREGDRLDLKAVDANTKKSGDQKFSFIGTKAFSKAGEVRYEKVKKETYVYLNTDSDKSAEAVIKLKGAMDLQKGWFVL